MGIYMGVLSLEQASPFFHAITQAQVAANVIWQIIDEVKNNRHSLFSLNLNDLSYSQERSILNSRKVFNLHLSKEIFVFLMFILLIHLDPMLIFSMV